MCGYSENIKVLFFWQISRPEHVALGVVCLLVMIVSLMKWVRLLVLAPLALPCVFTSLSEESVGVCMFFAGIATVIATMHWLSRLSCVVRYYGAVAVLSMPWAIASVTGALTGFKCLTHGTVTLAFIVGAAISILALKRYQSLGAILAGTMFFSPVSVAFMWPVCWYFARGADYYTPDFKYIFLFQELPILGFLTAVIYDAFLLPFIIVVLSCPEYRSACQSLFSLDEKNSPQPESGG